MENRLEGPMGMGTQTGAGTRRMRRSRSDRMLAGVCGGLAEHFGIDPTLVRLAFVAVELLTAGAGGIIAYVILWIVMPEA